MDGPVLDPEPQLDPVTIRHNLQTHRQAGHAWETAWKASAGPCPEGQGEIYKFMESHFRAAYLGTPSSLGRCRVPARDTHIFGGRARSVVGDGGCRSGSGCDAAAVGGRFGDHFCHYHLVELERVELLLGDGPSYPNARAA